MSPPLLYSFRRCPYAMRARLAIWAVGIRCELREVILREKPISMLEHSAKATVPVLVLADGRVIDESLEVMRWALAHEDAHPWLIPASGGVEEMYGLIQKNDREFKFHLDRYKYSNRHDDVDPLHHRAAGGQFLAELDARLATGSYLLGPTPCLADFAIVPFVRQFANTDRRWFDAYSGAALKEWLERLLDSPLFNEMMTKYPQWREGDTPTLIP